MENINQNPNFQPIPTPEPVKNSNIFKYLFFISIFILLGVIIGFYFILNNKISKLSSQQNNESSSLVSTPIPTVTPSENIDQNTAVDAQQTLNLLKRYLNVDVPLQKTNEYWFVENNANIFLTGFSFGLGTVKSNYMGKYGSYSDISSVTSTSLEPLQASIDNFFSTNNFKKDTVNTQIISTGTRLGYSRGNLKCLVSLTWQSDPFASLSCGIVDQTQIIWKKELEPALNPNNDPNILIRVDKLIGNYATGGAGSIEGGGYAWIALKTNNVWKKIWGGQDTIKCSVVNQYQIPKEIYGDCY